MALGGRKSMGFSGLASPSAWHSSLPPTLPSLAAPLSELYEFCADGQSDEDRGDAGTWYDRTQEYAARRRRGEDPDPFQYATPETLTFSPLPCWRICLRSNTGSASGIWPTRSRKTHGRTRR